MIYTVSYPNAGTIKQKTFEATPFTEEMREFYGLDNSWRDVVAESFA